MNNHQTPKVPLPKPMAMLIGTMEFADTLRRNPKTLSGMVREVTRTALSGVTHGNLNHDQESLLAEYAERGKKPKYIAVLVPGFQLDGTSLLGFKKTFNEQGIPAFFPGGLPSGKEAVSFRQHPDILVERIVKYVGGIQRRYPQAEILLVGHSYGGPQALHASKHLGGSEKASKIIPITVAGVLDQAGPMAQAAHAVYYRIPSHVFSGKDSFLEQAREIQAEQQQGITFVDKDDGYLTPKIQAGVYADTLHNNPHTIVSSVKSPGHYRQGVDAYFSEYIIQQIMKRLQEKERSATIPQ